MIRGQNRSVTNKNIMASIHNRFDIEVIDAMTGAVKQRAKAENVILDTIWTNYTSGWFYYLAYGSGNGTPTSGDKGLFNWKGAVGLGSEKVDTSHIRDGYVSYTKSASLSETTSVGITITEVGLAIGDRSTSTVCTHAMLEDMNGNPISILKTDTDIINLYATIFFHWDLTGYNGVEILANQTDNFPVALSFSFGTEYCYFSKGKNLGLSKEAWVGPKYDPSTRTITITCPRLNVGEMNYGGFQYVSWGPYIAKIAGPHRVAGESVGTGNGSTVDFATAFDFPSNATVYVDGVVTTDVIVSEEPLCHDDIGQYFQSIHPDSTDDCLIACNYSAPDSRYISHYNSTWYTFGLGTFFNPYYDKYGIDSYDSVDISRLEVSNDMVNWEIAYDSANGIRYDAAKYRNYKYWRSTSRNSNYSSHYWGKLKSNDLTGKNIHFTTPPPEGAIITIDYDTPLVPKDENHVYDFNLQVQVGAYSEG